MPKNIVICLDGTGNEIEENISNVLKIYRSIRRGEGQPVYYAQGVGTLAEVRPWSRIRQTLLDGLLGKMFGYGLDDKVTDAYRFIVNHYEAGDRIFIFGYSRGAYMARILAGMLHAVGLLAPQQENLIGAAYAAYLSEPRDHRDEHLGPSEDAVVEGESRARTFRRVTQTCYCPVHFLGLFDSVGSVFVPNYGLNPHWFFTRDPYPHTYDNPSVRTVRHAVAVDEYRHMFPVSLWPAGQSYRSNPFDPDPSPQRLDEVWFSGAHGDIGSEHARLESGLAQIPLIWMLEGAREAGLDVNAKMMTYVTGQGPLSRNTRYLYPAPDPTAKLHGSMTPFWWPFEWVPSQMSKVRRRPGQKGRWHIPGFRRRQIGPEAVIHDSVYERMKRLADYRPENVPPEI